MWQKPIYQQVRHYCSILTSPMPSTYLVSIPSSCQCQSTSSGDSQSRICVCGCPAYSYHRSCRQIPRITKRSTVLLEWTLSCLWYMYTEHQYSRAWLAWHLCKPLHCVICPPCLFRPTDNFFSSANQARQAPLYWLGHAIVCMNTTLVLHHLITS